MGKKSSPVRMGYLAGGWEMGAKEFVQFNQKWKHLSNWQLDLLVLLYTAMTADTRKK